MAARGRSRNRSPDVRMISIRTAAPARSRRARVHSACHSARRLPRLPMTRGLTPTSPAILARGLRRFLRLDGALVTGIGDRGRGWRVDAEDLADQLPAESAA